jgi:hypothetical protein
VDGHDFTKFCSVTGISVMEFQWLKGEEVVETDTTAPGHYFISNAEITADNSGQYYCRVKRSDGTLTESHNAGTLTVLENEVIVAPSPQYAVLGSSIELQCAITAEGVTIIDTWAVGDDTNFETGLNVLSPVEMGDEGMYTCRLNDENMEMDEFDTNIEFRITVPPLILTPPESLYTFTDDAFQSSISVGYSGREGDTSVVEWRKDGETLATSGEGYEIQASYSTADLEATTSLVFTDSYLSRSFEGTYNVVITNENDVIPEAERIAMTFFSISVTVLPATITNVNVTSKPPLSAVVEWVVVYRHADEHPDNITIFVENVETGATSCHQVGDPVSTQSAEVGVVPGVVYSVTVESANEDGRNRTVPVTFTTAPAAPSVSAVEVSRLNSTSFSISTTLLYTGGGSVTQLIVSFRIIGDTEWSGDMRVTVVRESDPLVWTGVVTNSEFAQYARLEFRVHVENDRALVSTDETPHSEPLVLPLAPVRIEAISTTTTSAVVEVELSPEGTPPMIVVMELTSHPELGCCGNQTIYVGGGSVRFVITGLSRDTTYTVSVSAMNHAGQGIGKQESFSTDGNGTVLPLWQTVLIGVCGAIALVVLTVLFCLLLCCGCKASKKWGRREYHTGPIEMAHRELERGNPMLTRSIRSNGYAGSQVSFGSNQGRPLTPRTPTGLSVTSPSFEYTDAPKYSELTTSRMSSSVFHTSSKDKLTHSTSISHGNLYYPTYPNDFPEESGYQSLPRGMDRGFPFGSITLSPPPAPVPCSTDV